MTTINMDYCKFENTVLAVEQCLEDWQNANLSKSEADARQRLFELAYAIVEEYDPLIGQEEEQNTGKESPQQRWAKTSEFVTSWPSTYEV